MQKRKISANIVADSIGPQGHRITSFILTYPRFIHSELMSHRLFSRNSASSRAIPFERMPFSSGDPIVGFTGLNPNNGNKYGWCNNFRGFIQYRHLVENGS